MAELWTRIQKTTITKHFRDVEENLMQNQVLTALMMKKGRVSYGHGGKNLDWPVLYARNSMSQYGDMQGVNFTRFNRHQTATLDWRGYITGEQISKMEKLANKGKEAIVRFTGNLVKMMEDDIKYNFAAELYKDGNATGREHAIHGFKSWLGVTGSNRFTAPSDTYAGLSTVLGNYGGSVQSGSWPSGKMDPEYMFWSPIIVNYTHADYGGTATWAANCKDALRDGITFQSNAKGGKQGKLDVIVCTSSMYRDFLNTLDEKERIIVDRGAQNSELVALGFKGVVNFDGVDITMDADCTDTQAFGLNFDSLELCSMQDQLFVPMTSEDHDTLTTKHTVDFFGNLKGNPRTTVLWDDIT